ncbi:MAG: hypothetical protein ACFCU8_03665 [Thermosynechococcaceae cyanobacterium]
MTSLTKIVWVGLGVAIATSLHTPVSAQTTTQPETAPTSAAALGGPLQPSNPKFFQTPEPSADNTIKVEDADKEKASRASAGTSLDWQSEHLDKQRRGESGFSLVNVNL